MWNSTDIQNMYPVRTLNFKGGLFSGPKTSEANWVSYGDFVVFHFWESWFVMNHNWPTSIGWIKLWQDEFPMIPITRTLGHSKNFLMIMNQDDHHFIKKLYFIWINIFLSIDRVMMGLIIVLMIGLIYPNIVFCYWSTHSRDQQWGKWYIDPRRSSEYDPNNMVLLSATGPWFTVRF